MHILQLALCGSGVCFAYILFIFSLSFLSYPPSVLAELQRANLVTSEECKMLHGLDDVIRVLSGKSAAKYILKKHGLVDESKFISGNQIKASLGKCYNFVDWS